MRFLSELYHASHLNNLFLGYDGKKSVFAAGPLPFESKEFVVNINENDGYISLLNHLFLIIGL